MEQQNSQRGIVIMLHFLEADYMALTWKIIQIGIKPIRTIPLENVTNI